MKKLYLLAFLFLGLAFGCLDDEGNYKYTDLKEPNWYSDAIADPISLYATEHDTLKLRGHDAFKWNADSAQREHDVRYEWRLNDVVIATEADIDVPTDSVIKWANIQKLCSANEYIMGSFTIIDESLGTHFMKLATFCIMPFRGNGDWYVLVEENGGAQCYFIDRGLNREESKDEFSRYDSFDEVNGISLSGRPVALSYARTATNVSPLGALTLMTDNAAYEIDASTFKVHAEVKDLFEGGAPAGFCPVARIDAWESSKNVGLNTFLADADGQIYWRQLSRNNLGGSFINTPYELDDKGYKITRFGSKAYGITGGGAGIPCWDEKNNRIVMILFNYQASGGWDDPYYTAVTFKTLEANASLTDFPPVWGFEQGTKVLNVGYISSAMFSFSSSGNVYSVVYNCKGKTYCGEFIINPVTGSLHQSAPGFGPFGGRWDSKVVEAPVYIPDDAQVLVSSTAYNTKANKSVLYTNGSKVNYLNISSNYENKELITDFPEKVTYIGYATYRNGYVSTYNVLVVGGENGTLRYYDITDPNQVKSLATIKFNGKVVMAKEVSTEVVGIDEY